MEDILGWLLVASILVVPGLAIYAGIKLYKRHKEKQLEADRRWIAEADEQASRMREQARLSRATDRARRLNLATPTPAKLRAGTSTVTPTPSSPSDSMLSDLATFYVLNSVLNSASDTARASVDYDTKTIKVETDDSSRTYDSGPSYSSSSDSYSSSSDSGPSSDW